MRNFDAGQQKAKQNHNKKGALCAPFFSSKLSKPQGKSFPGSGDSRGLTRLTAEDRLTGMALIPCLLFSGFPACLFVYFLYLTFRTLFCAAPRSGP